MNSELKMAKLSYHTKIESEQNTKIKIVVGNESCDLDSVACALAYASLLTYENNRHQTHNHIFPILNAPKKDLKIKTEVAYFLNKFQISEDDLFFRDDFDKFVNHGRNGELEVVLVDHNFNSTFNEWVVEVIDHHPLTVEYPSSVAMTLDLVGSCSSLVLQKISTRSELCWINKELAYMLYASILLDTNNLSEVTQRWKPLDLEMLLAIEPIVLSDEVKSRTDYFTHLLTIKCNVEWMSPFDLLFKDKKETCGLAVCSLPLLVQMYAVLDSAENALKSYCAHSQTEEIILMGLHIQNGAVSKDIGFYSNSDSTRMNRLSEELKNMTVPNLMLSRIDVLPYHIQGLAIYNINNLLITRKHVLPAITHILSALLSGAGN